MNKHIKIIAIQAVFLIVVLVGLYFIYPKASMELQGNSVNLKSINAHVIVLSENPDFSNPRYLEINEGENISFNLNPGTYYWKSDNGMIQGMKNKFTIESEVGLGINRENETGESDLVNIGNVKINVTKSKEGVMVGHIILEPEKSEKIEDTNEEYVGRQNE